MAAYHFGYHDYPLTGEDCPVCQERDDAIGEEEAIAAAEAEEAVDGCVYCGAFPETYVNMEGPMCIPCADRMEGP